MIREELKQFFDQRGLSHQLTWAESLRPEMLELVRREAGQDYDLITSVRWADVYGLFKTFMYSANPTPTQLALLRQIFMFKKEP
jgi:hypothetical protein